MSTDESFVKLWPHASLRCVMLVVLAGLWALAISTGCHHPTHREQRREAQEGWNRFRAEFKLRLAKQQLEQGQIREAIATLQQAAALDPTSPIYDRLLAKCYLEAGSPEATRKAIFRAKSLGDTSAALAYTQGMLAERQSRYEEALRCYREAADGEPTNTDYLLATAQSLVNLGHALEAKAFLDEQLRKTGEQEQLLLLRARVCVLLNNLEQAAADFEAAEDFLADTPWIAEEFGLVLVRLGRYAEALAVLRPLVESAGLSSDDEPGAAPVSPTVVRALATCYNHIGAPGRAKKLTEKRLRQSPDDGRSWWLLTESFIRLRDWESALHCVQRGEQVAPQRSDWRLFRAYLTFRDGDFARTTTLLESILAEQPDDALAHRFLCQVHEQHKELDRARDH